MTNSQIFTAAHKLAKTFEGNYSACFAEALRIVWAESKKENDIMLVKSGNKRTADAGTHKQLDYLANLCNVSSFGFSHKKWAAYFSKSELSNAITAVKNGEKVNIEL